MFFWEMGTTNVDEAVPTPQGIERERSRQLHALREARKKLFRNTFRPSAASGALRLRAG